MGRRSFEGYNALHAQHPDSPMVAFLERVDRYVASTTASESDWPGTTVLRDDVYDQLAGLKQQPGGDILVCGSPSLIRGLLSTEQEPNPVARPRGREERRSRRQIPPPGHRQRPCVGRPHRGSSHAGPLAVASVCKSPAAEPRWRSAAGATSARVRCHLPNVGDGRSSGARLCRREQTARLRGGGLSAVSSQRRALDPRAGVPAPHVVHSAPLPADGPCSLTDRPRVAITQRSNSSCPGRG